MNYSKFLTIMCLVTMMALAPTLGLIDSADAKGKGKKPKITELFVVYSGGPIGPAGNPTVIDVFDKKGNPQGSFPVVAIGDKFSVTPIAGKDHLESRTIFQIFDPTGAPSTLQIHTSGSQPLESE